MTIKELFAKYLHQDTNVNNAINELADFIDVEWDEYKDSDNQYLDVLGNEIRGFKNNDSFYIFGINNYQFDYQQFDYQKGLKL